MLSKVRALLTYYDAFILRDSWGNGLVVSNTVVGNVVKTP